MKQPGPANDRSCQEQEQKHPSDAIKNSDCCEGPLHISCNKFFKDVRKKTKYMFHSQLSYQ